MIAARALGAFALAAIAGCGASTGSTPRPAGSTGPGNTAPKVALVPGTLADLHGEVLDIEIAGISDDRYREAMNLISTRVGATFAVATVAADIHALWQLNGIADVKVAGRIVGRGVALRYTLRDLPKITKIEVEGATAIATDEIIELMPAKRGYPIDPGAFNRYRQTLLEQYRELGFANATVEWKTVRRDDGADVVFTIAEGAPVQIATIDLRGNKAVGTKTLLAELGKDNGPVVGGRYWELALERGLLYVSSYYYDHGYVEVKIDAPVVTPSADGASVALAIGIAEGSQYKLGTISFTGSKKTATDAEYARRLGVKAGDIFSRAKLADGLRSIDDLQASTSHGAARQALPTTQIDAKKKRVNVTIELE